MPEVSPSHELLESGELKNLIHKFIEEVVEQDKSVEAFDVPSRINQELLFRKDENNEFKYVQFQPLVPVDPKNCLAHYRSWHYLVGSSEDGIEPLYDDLPGEDSIIFILKKWLEESKKQNAIRN